MSDYYEPLAARHSGGCSCPYLTREAPDDDIIVSERASSGGIAMTTDLPSFSRTLFAAANQLWTNSALRPDQYAQPVLALIALRQMEAKFQAVHAELAPHLPPVLRMNFLKDAVP